MILPEKRIPDEGNDEIKKKLDQFYWLNIQQNLVSHSENSLVSR